MNRNILEICWIVDKRNKWAKQRKSLRNKYYRLSSIYRRSEEAAKAKVNYSRHNESRLELRVYTKRLKALLREESLKLISDKNAGYSFIVVSQKTNRKDNFTLAHDPSIRLLDKKGVRELAVKFEADILAEKMLLGKESMYVVV